MAIYGVGAYYENEYGVSSDFIPRGIMWNEEDAWIQFCVVCTSLPSIQDMTFASYRVVLRSSLIWQTSRSCSSYINHQLLGVLLQYWTKQLKFSKILKEVILKPQIRFALFANKINWKTWKIGSAMQFLWHLKVIACSSNHANHTYYPLNSKKNGNQLIL